MTIKRMWYIIRISFMNDGFKRAEYLKKKDVFAYIGEHCFWQPRNIPAEAKLIKMHDNVVIASEVLFVNHDVIHNVFNNMEAISLTEIDNQTDFIENSEADNRKNSGYYNLNLGAIEIGNNVFIGSRSTILLGAKIEDNAIFGAGSLITGDLYKEGIYAGVPAKRIGDIDALIGKRKLEKKDLRNKEDRFDEVWNEFYQRYSK